VHNERRRIVSVDEASGTFFNTAHSYSLPFSAYSVQAIPRHIEAFDVARLKKVSHIHICIIANDDDCKSDWGRRMLTR